jgi:hypothetical protein
METFGRTSYVWRFPGCDAKLDVSLELASKPVGDVALLDIEERADEASSVIIEEAIESRALSGLRCTLTSGRGGLTWAPGLQQKVN